MTISYKTRKHFKASAKRQDSLELGFLHDQQSNRIKRVSK